MEEEIDKQMKTEQTYHLQKLSDITICIIYLWALTQIWPEAINMAL